MNACVNDANVVYDFVFSNTCNDNLKSATDNELNVLGNGVININNVPILRHMRSNLVENLVSSHVLTEHTLTIWLLFPQKKLGGFVIGINEEGNVIIKTGANYYIQTSILRHVPKQYTKSLLMLFTH